jgi:hypothetical protein
LSPDDDELDDLGAAPTRPAAQQPRAERPRRSRPRLRRVARRPLARLVIVLAVVVGLALVPAVVSSFKKTPRNMVGISYGGGPFESAHFQRIVNPGSRLFFNGLFDPLYNYPADTQTYIVSKVKGEGAVSEVDSIVAPSRDRVQIEFQIAVYFKLNVGRLRSFHEQLGIQYTAYNAAGWDRLIQDTFRQQIENALQQETRRYDVADIYGNAEDLTAIETEVEAKLSERLTSALGQPFFCGPTYRRGGSCPPPTFVIKKIDIPSNVADAFEANRTAQIGIEQRTAEAEAIGQLNTALAEAGMPYVLLRAIEEGKVTFWALPTEGGVSLEVPGDGSAPAAPAPATTTTTTPGG